MKKSFYIVFAFLSYGLSSIVTGVEVLFLSNKVLPKTIDQSCCASLPLSPWVINTALILLFGVQHSVMARESVKVRMRSWIPLEMERSLYVLMSSIVLGLIFLFWQPLPDQVWSVQVVWARYLIWGIFILGIVWMLGSTYLVDHFQLFGLKQPFGYISEPDFGEKGLYKYMRHPIMFGFLLMFWATPDMSVGHMFFAATMTVYILIGVHFEEKSLRLRFGERYASYQKRVPKLFPKII